MKSNANKIISTYLLLLGFYTLSTSMIWGINTLFLLNAGLSIFQVFIVNAIYSASMALFEIPTGVFADTLGRRKSFIYSTFVLMLGTIGYMVVGSIPNNFYLFCMMSFILGIAYTFYSGALEAWLVDELIHVNYQGGLDKVFTKSVTITNVAILVGTISGGAIGTINLNFPYLARSILQLVVLVMAVVLMKEIGYQTKQLKVKAIPNAMKETASISVQYGVKNKSMRYLMMMSFIFSSFMMWGWYAWQPYFLDLFGDTSAVWLAGLISASISLAQIVGSVVSQKLGRRIHRRTTIFIVGYAIQAVMIFITGFSNVFIIAVGAFILFAFGIGFVTPSKQTYLHELAPSEQRATIVSLNSLVSSAGSVVGQVGYGYVSENVSISAGYMIGGLVNVLILPVAGLLRKQNDEEDLIDKKRFE